jgi:uncharacterized protein (TIGR02996 family)
MNAEMQAFLAAIRDDPDDGPRLVFADWLTENDKPRWAELIRLQVQLSHLAYDDPRRPVLRQRERQLLDDMTETSVVAEMDYPVQIESFDRGLPASVSLPARWFMASAERILNFGPVPAVHLTAVAGHERQLADCPYLQALTDLSLWHNELTTNGLSLLLDTPYLTNLQRLDLTDCQLDSKAGAVLAGSAGSRLTRLGHLSLNSNQLGNAGVHDLFCCDYWKHLGILELTDTGVNARLGLSAAYPHPSVHALDLSYNTICFDTPQIDLLDCFSPLTTLSLRYCRLHPEHISNLINSPAITTVRNLHLDGNMFDENVLRQLLDSPNLRNLHELTLGKLPKRGISKATREGLRERYGIGGD